MNPVNIVQGMINQIETHITDDDETQGTNLTADTAEKQLEPEDSTSPLENEVAPELFLKEIDDVIAMADKAVEVDFYETIYLLILIFQKNSNNIARLTEIIEASGWNTTPMPDLRFSTPRSAQKFTPNNDQKSAPRVNSKSVPNFKSAQRFCLNALIDLF